MKVKQSLFIKLKSRADNQLSKFIVSLLKKKYYLVGRIKSHVYRMTFASCGQDLKIYGNPLISEPNKIFLGNHVTINNGVQLCPRGKIIVSDYVTMSRGAQVTAGQLDLRLWTNNGFRKKKHVEDDVFLGEGTWLCVNSVILPGVKITGKGVVVAAGAVVTKDIAEDYVIVGGIPAKIIKKIDDYDKAVRESEKIFG